MSGIEIYETENKIAIYGFYKQRTGAGFATINNFARLEPNVITETKVVNK